MSFASGGSRWSDVHLAMAAKGISVCGDFLAATALALALQSAGAGGLAVSGLLIASTLPLVLFAPVTGRLADRVDSRTLLVTAGLAQGAICVALAYTGDPVLLIVLTGLLACGLATTQPVLAALLPAMVRPEDLPRASAVNQTATTLGVLVGPALAGLLVGEFGVRPPLLLDAVSYLALVAAGLLLRTRRGGRRTTRPGSGGGTPTPAWRLRHDPLLFTMTTVVGAALLFVMAMIPIEVFYVRETLGASTTTYGMVHAAWMLGVLPGSWICARLARRLVDDGALVRGTLTLLCGTCLVVAGGALMPNAVLLMPLWLVGGLFNGGENVFNNVVMARRVPEAARGHAFAAFGAALQGSSMGGYLIGGALLEVVEPRPLMAASGAAGMLVLVAAAPAVRALLRRDAAERTRDAGLATSAQLG